MNFNSISHITLFLITATVLLSAVACSEEKLVTFDGPVIAEVGGQKLLLGEALAGTPSFVLRADSAAAIHQFREQWIKKQILLKEAEKSGIPESLEFQYRQRIMSEELQVQLLMERLREVATEVRVSEEEALNYYERHRDKFVLQERHLRFHHMVTASNLEASNARQQLLAGAEWEEVAETYSIDPDYAISNSSKIHPESTALENYPAIAHFVRLIGVTEVSPIRLIDGNYHFVQLLDDYPAGEIPDLDWALSHVEKWITLEKKQQQIRSYEQSLIRNAELNLNIRRID